MNFSARFVASCVPCTLCCVCVAISCDTHGKADWLAVKVIILYIKWNFLNTYRPTRAPKIKHPLTILLFLDIYVFECVKQWQILTDKLCLSCFPHPFGMSGKCDTHSVDLYFFRPASQSSFKNVRFHSASETSNVKKAKSVHQKKFNEKCVTRNKWKWFHWKHETNQRLNCH